MIIRINRLTVKNLHPFFHRLDTGKLTPLAIWKNQSFLCLKSVCRITY